MTSESFELTEFIGHAKEPIIKMNYKPTGTNVDISLNNIHGLQNAVMIKEYLQKIPEIMPCAMFIKNLLKINNLNIPFEGGVGSYTQMIMLISYFNVLK